MSTAIRRPESDPISSPFTASRSLTPDRSVPVTSGPGSLIAIAIRIMARRRRLTPGGYVYHVCNRGSRKGVLFDSCEDYESFIRLMEHARRKFQMRIIAYCLLSTHLHFLLWP